MIEKYGGSDWDGPTGIRRVQVPSTTAYYAVQAPAAGVQKDTALLVVLHGWGQSARSFLRRFHGLKHRNILVVAIQAPNQFYVDMETRKVGFHWLTNFDRRTATSDIVTLVDTVLGEVEQAYGWEGAPFLLGFSQGVSVAYRYALLGASPVSGVIACGGDLPPDVAASLPGARPFPVLLIHGKEDAIVPIQKCEDAAAQFEALKVQADVRLFDGGHDIPGMLMDEIDAWIRGHQGA